MKHVLLCLFLLSAGVTGAVEWKNLDAEHHLGGRKTSEGYLRGKVVLVCRWDPTNETSRTMLCRLEEIWQSFKSKPFVILGGSYGDQGVTNEMKKFVADSAVTFPVYANAALGVHEPVFKKLPFLYVVDETGKIVYLGREDRNATQAVVMALTDMEAPRNLKQLKRFLDFELETLPGRAYLRADAFRREYPAEAKEYYEKFKALTEIPDVRQLADLVAFARRAKDMRPFDAKTAGKKRKFAALIDSALSKYAPLAESKDPRVAQEAKNSLADLKWTQAAL